MAPGGVPVFSALRGVNGPVKNAPMHLCKHLARIFAFLLIAIICYSPFGSNWINNPSPSWDANRTADSWDTDQWSWDVVDCIYFAMVTMTTVGYGDMPSLRQEMRLFTMVFGFLGVVFVASSINAIADAFSEMGRKNFISRQRVLLQEAKMATEIVRTEIATPKPPSGAVDAPPSPPPSPPKIAPAPEDEEEDDPMDMGSKVRTQSPSAAMEPGDAPRHSDISVVQMEPSPPKYGLSAPPAAAVSSTSVPVAATPTSKRKSREGRPSKDPKEPHTPQPARTGGPPSDDGSSGAWRLPSRKTVLRVLKAFRLTALYFALCILLGEVENSQIDGCGFGVGWTCLSPYSCETWRAGSWPDDPPGVDRSYCWTWIDQIYYAVITFCTIGFGDVTPHSKAGKLLGAVLVAFGVFCFTTLLAELVEFKNSQRLGADKTLAQRLEELREVILQDNDGTVSPEEYIIFNLKKMGKVDDELLLLLRDQFNTLDADGSGELDESDINMLSSAAAKVEAVKREQQRLAPAA